MGVGRHIGTMVKKHVVGIETSYAWNFIANSIVNKSKFLNL